jgi:hypothetical protein
MRLEIFIAGRKAFFTQFFAQIIVYGFKRAAFLGGKVIQFPLVAHAKISYGAKLYVEGLFFNAVKGVDYCLQFIFIGFPQEQNGNM